MQAAQDAAKPAGRPFHDEAYFGGNDWQTMNRTDAEQQIQPNRFRKKFSEFEKRLMCRIMDSSGTVKLLKPFGGAGESYGAHGSPDRERCTF